VTFRPSDRPPDDEERIGSSNQSHDSSGKFGAGNVPGTVSGHGKKGGPYAQKHSPGGQPQSSGGGGGGGGGESDPTSGESSGGTNRPGKKETITSAGQSPAVQAWLGPSQAAINQEAISGQPGQYAQVIAQLDAEIKASKPHTADLVVYREISGAETLTIGGTVTTKGFMATSPTPLSATASRITIPAGAHALTLPGEVLLPRGTQLRVDGPRQFTVLLASNGRQLAYYRALWMRSSTSEERREILAAVNRIQGGMRP
jgi:hypothetical protein